MSAGTQFSVHVLVALLGVLAAAGALAWSVRKDPRSLRNGVLVVVAVH